MDGAKLPKKSALKNNNNVNLVVCVMQDRQVKRRIQRCEHNIRNESKEGTKVVVGESAHGVLS